LEWVSLAAIGGVLWLGSILILRQELNFSILTTFILYAQTLFNPLRQFAERFTTVQAGLTALERVSNILNEPVEIRDPEQLSSTSIKVPSLRDDSTPGTIQFDHVWFGSIIRLLCRLYEVSKGRILLDGQDIRDMPQGELRRRMAVVLQDGFLFAGDVKGNISLGESYSMAEIQAAAKQTNVDQFIAKLPQGYDTPLRQRGTNLSGGEKQLLAFARAAIRNPGILVLDEATANLDVGTESTIQKALETLLVDRTAIIIAHRLSTIRNVDRILVLKQGQLAESGSHEELLEQEGLYSSLYRLQMLET
jgi:ATP-binding cassette subfamily B protein